MRLPEAPKKIRVMGFDDAPFDRSGTRVNVSGIVTSGTRFEGMVWGETERDGWGATDLLSKLLCESKYHAQVHAVLTDGIAVGGFALIDLPRLAAETERPCIAVMRKLPDLAAVRSALSRLDRVEERLELLERAGEIHSDEPFVFQVAGASPDFAREVLHRCTDRGKVPEALRLAHLIGSAVIDGQSRGRA